MTLDPFLRCRRHRSERWKLETGHVRIPEYQELQRNKSSLPTFILASSTTPNNPNVATSVVEKKVNLLADEHGECEGRGTSGKQSLRRRICQFRSFNINSMDNLKVLKN